MRQKINWEDIKLFLALVRSGTVRGAAEKLGLSHSTVARRTDAMEKQLAVRLFDRLPTGYAVTPAGEDMLSVAEDVENELNGLERRILGHDSQLAGHIRFTMVDFLSTDLLMPHLAKFMQKYPDIDLEIITTYDAMNLDNREADIALRFGQNPPEHLFGRRLTGIATAAYASEKYIECTKLDNPAAAQWIGFGANNQTPKWVKESAFPHLPVKGRFISLLVQLEACKAHMGLAMLPCFLGDGAPSLKRLSPPELKPNFDLWLLNHRDVRTTARFRVFSDFIATAIKSQRDVLQAGE